MGITVLSGSCIPLNRNNIDTDQIIPARFLKGTVKSGLGKTLFNDWRYLADGAPNPAFELNQPQYQGASFLVAPHNFGCGSSREHAPWALKDYGFQAIFAISFADIFKNNALKNQVMPIVLPEPVISALLEQVETQPDFQVTVDLPSQQVRFGVSQNTVLQYAVPFEIDPYRKTCLMDGLDDIGYTLSHLETIKQFEKQLV
jgi:3-isopropylmalate/(R)-2-methylmalate dehydratase small subunit